MEWGWQRVLRLPLQVGRPRRDLRRYLPMQATAKIYRRHLHRILQVDWKISLSWKSYEVLRGGEGVATVIKQPRPNPVEFKERSKEEYISSSEAADMEGEEECWSWLLPFATPAQRPLLSKAAEGTPVHLHWIPYDWATNGTEVPLDKHIYSVTLP
ncbi:hypothetical protein AK812_SmicGene22184 [Symbiodinium microadriaticum]|uniref:Uncharacterized protein n=1 Tax=Symbiodinium microadriaticum TaxID=2951 RepID=A0A1Q9DKG0_SYMMI|nr:hypothetical protein AK812_SmicGene22184 [Symbiodinium microadriaticum]